MQATHEQKQSGRYRRNGNSDHLATGAIGTMKDVRFDAFQALVGRNALTQEDFDRAVDTSLRTGCDLEIVLMQEYRLSAVQLGEVLSAHYQCPYVPFDSRIVVTTELRKIVKIDFLRRHKWVPLRHERGHLQVVIDNPADVDRVLDIKYAFPGLRIDLCVGLRRDIARWLDAMSGGTIHESIEDILGELVRDIETTSGVENGRDGIDENNSAIVRLTNQIISEAHRQGASDIHLEPYAARKDLVVRFRVDGSCFTYMKVPATYRRAMVSRIKIMANLDIAESRRPQDGKIRFRTLDDRDIELRVATLPTAGQNEDVVMRILTTRGLLPLEDMDISTALIQSLTRLVTRPYGILLCVGPTGSGKTTTLHALLSRINDEQRKIWTVEDPIEITQEGLRQLQVHPKIGLTFATALRAFLRADPDVIMVGEMRDKETADIAIEASLTGHLVLSTLHTNSAVETVTRLLDLGCDGFNFADAMLGVLAKRLCKRLCERCKEPYRPSAVEQRELIETYGASFWARLGRDSDEIDTLWRASGCEACNRTGFRGRLGLYELLQGTDELKLLIQTKARAHELLRLAISEGMNTLMQDGISKILEGKTTLQEVRRVAFK